MKLQPIKSALQGLVALSAILALGTLSAWAGSGPPDFSTGGSGIGTLPSTSGGNGVVSGQDTGNDNVGFGVMRDGASFYLTLPERGLRQVVLSATGSGFVHIVPTARGLVRAEFHGAVTLVLDESLLRSLNAKMGLVSEGTAPVVIGMRLDSIPTAPVTVAGGVATSLPILSLMHAGKTGTQELILESMQAPFRPSQVQITRGAGVLVLTQSTF